MIAEKSTAKRGFSLVELLVIVAVIGILAALIIPSFLGTDDKVEAQSDENSIETLNASLDSADALKTDLSSVEKVRAYFEKGGYSGDSLKPETKGVCYVWDASLNAILMVNLSDDTVAAPERFVGETNEGDWYFIHEEPTAANNHCLYPSAAGIARLEFAKLLEDQAPTDDEILFVSISDIEFSYEGTLYRRPGYVAYAHLTYDGEYEDGTRGPRLGQVHLCSRAEFDLYNGTAGGSAVQAGLLFGISTDGTGERKQITDNEVYFEMEMIPGGSEGYNCWRYRVVRDFEPGEYSTTEYMH